MPTPEIRENMITENNKLNIKNNKKFQSTSNAPKVEITTKPDTPLWDTIENFNALTNAPNSRNTSGKSSKRNSFGSDDGQPQQLKSELYKTEICKKWEEEGFCKYGKRCQYAHGNEELRNVSRHQKYKSKLCNKFHTTGVCAYGQRCIFIHRIKPEHKRLSTFIDTCSNKILSQNVEICNGFNGLDDLPDTKFDQIDMHFVNGWKDIKLL